MTYTPEEKDKALELLLGFTNERLSGYLKELGLRYSGTKEDYKDRFLSALNSGKLTYSDIVTWLDVDASWGKQHV